MDRIEIYQEIRSMQIAYSFHFVFYIILGVEHILIILKIFWNNNNIKKIFFSCSIIDLVILFYPIIPLILMYRIILKKNLTKLFKILSLIIIIISIILGIIITVSFWINLKSTTDFYKECPYNLNDISLILKEENSSKRCNKRRCILISKINYEGYYNYICNYNSAKDFEVEPGVQYPYQEEDGTTSYLKDYIKCEQKTSIEELFNDKININSNNDIYKYTQKCWNNNEFYLCERYELHDKFDVSKNYKCPKENYNVILYICGIFLIALDIILSFIPWSFDYKSYSRIISMNEENEDENLEDNENNNEQQRRRHNETNTSSNNQNLNNGGGGGNNNHQNENNNNNQNNNIGNENNERNNENDFIHQPTETIIIVKKTFNSSSNIKSSDRLNSGLNSNDASKSNSNNNKRKNKKGKENIIGSMISQSESQNMISKTSEKENESEDSKTIGKNKLALNKPNNQINDKNNEIDDINFKNDIRYDEYKNNNDEDEKDIDEDKKSENNCIIKNKNIKKKKKIVIRLNQDKANINFKETNNSIMTTIKNKEEIFENTKNNDNSYNHEDIGQFVQINENNRNKTPKKEIKSLNFNFSQVLTNIRDSDQITLFNNTNGSIIKEERKEETDRSNKEEEKNNLSHKENKRNNLRRLTPFKIKNKTNDKDSKEEKKFNTINNIKNDSQSSLLIENSNKSGSNSQLKEENKKKNNLINCVENQ